MTISLKQKYQRAVITEKLVSIDSKMLAEAYNKGFIKEVSVIVKALNSINIKLFPQLNQSKLATVNAARDVLINKGTKTNKGEPLGGIYAFAATIKNFFEDLNQIVDAFQDDNNKKVSQALGGQKNVENFVKSALVIPTEFKKYGKSSGIKSTLLGPFSNKYAPEIGKNYNGIFKDCVQVLLSKSVEEVNRVCDQVLSVMNDSIIKGTQQALNAEASTESQSGNKENDQQPDMSAIKDNIKTVIDSLTDPDKIDQIVTILKRK